MLTSFRDYKFGNLVFKREIGQVCSIENSAPKFKIAAFYIYV